MGRRLPWETTADKRPARAGPARKPESPKLPEATRASASRLDATRGRAAAGLLSDRLRSPSTSPPPEPPRQQFMVAADDRYRMVEDELLHTAQRFTTHLHHAEYHRLKGLAKRQHADTIRAIERPVVGPPTATARARREASKRAAKQRKVLGAVKLPCVGTGLDGLMERPGIESRCIPSSLRLPVRSPTRAAAGFQLSTTPGDANPSPASSRREHRIPSTSTASGESGHSTPTSRRVAASRPPSSASRVLLATSHTSDAADTPSPSATVRDSVRGMGGLAHAGGDDDGRDDQDPFGINQRRARRERARGQTRKRGDTAPPRRLSPDTIPLFL